MHVSKINLGISYALYAYIIYIHVFTLFIWTLNMCQKYNLVESKALLRRMNSAVYLIVIYCLRSNLFHHLPAVTASPDPSSTHKTPLQTLLIEQLPNTMRPQLLSCIFFFHSVAENTLASAFTLYCSHDRH